MHHPFKRRVSLLTAAGTLSLVMSSLLAGPALATGSDLTVVDPKVNHVASPLLVDGSPVFSWQLTSGARGATQSAYRIQVADSTGALVWDSGKVSSSQSVDVAYGGPDLAATASYSWNVSVWDAQGAQSAPASGAFRTGLRSTDGTTNWQNAQWITGSAIQMPRGEDRFEALTFDLQATFQIISEGAAITFGGDDDEFTAAAVRKVDGAWHLQLLDGSSRGIAVFTRERNVPRGETWPDEKKFAPVDIALDPTFDPKVPHTLKVSEAGPDDSVFPGSSKWTIALDGKGLTTFELAANRTLLRAGRLGLGLEGLSASYTDLSLAMPNSPSPLKLEETSAFLAAGPHGSIFHEVEGAEIADGKITVRDRHVEEPDTTPSDGMFRKTFHTPSKVTNATLYASALGVVEFELNGAKVGDTFLAPGTTDFKTTGLYNAYDVTDMVTPGDNTLGAILGDGWYSGSFGALHKPYGPQPSFKALLRLTHQDGTVESIVTDPTWSYFGQGPILDSNIMDGESYDAGREAKIQGWSTSTYTTTGWVPSSIAAHSVPRVVADEASAITAVEEVAPISRTVDSNGNVVFDFGKNMVGVPRIAVTGKTGQVVELSYGEMLNDSSPGADGPAGTVYNANFRSAKATDHYRIGPSGTGTFQPKFTVHGFRYLEVSGIDGFDPNSVASEDVKGIVLSSAKTLTMDFDSSNADINTLYHNTINGLRGNFLSIPTDTPARDERMGWLGDIQVFAPAATMTADVRNFLGKFTSVDMAASQMPDGHYPRFTPWHSGWDFTIGKSDPWTDATIIVPHALWQTYGDTAIIDANWAQMTKYAQALRDGERGPILGDWLAPTQTDSQFVFKAYKAHVISLLEQMARAAGHTAQADGYAAWRDQWRAAFLAEYFPDGGATLTGENLDTQAAYAMVLEFGLYPQGKAPEIAAHLAELSRGGEGGASALTTGFLGTPVILPALSANGQVDAAYDLLLSHTYPSWLYSVDQGATTFWERWNSYTKESGFGDVSMNSFNHYAYGAVSKWIYSNVAGIDVDPSGAGFAKSVLRPRMDADGRVTWANATFKSVHGPIVSHWRLNEGGNISYHVEIPANTSSRVFVPTLDTGETLYEGAVPVTQAEGVKVVGTVGDTVELEVASGSYDFTVKKDGAPGLVVDPSRVAQGGNVTISGIDLPAGAPVELIVHSDPVTVGTVTSDASGKLSQAWKVPTDFPAGEHVVLACDSSGNELAKAAMTVVSSGNPGDPGRSGATSAAPGNRSDGPEGQGCGVNGSMSLTGAAIGWTVAVVAALGALGAGAFVLVRRKRK
ncbi:family 78 glycoside hydrolase catalytic domain [Schaalia sp. 19OD2882]|uniref:alpha-L-rhamnosidase n=1 Tax=Schaalia sp. 19OD2882 TaxID=2794089 RepID=UPI001C1EE3CC|nr:alpha-L-rhamnosidase [Schaalia sp. 19OD2882]QWW19453.1 family 78 glycoside hydrolase catalytic domain [Schaalia sp. 19OD2882]